jgi:hypothetical protein
MAWLGLAIHVFAVCSKERRGWPGKPGHDVGAITAPVEEFIVLQSVMATLAPGD